MSITISGSGAITGASTSYSFDQAVSIAGTVTYEDVSNVDSVGIITANAGIDISNTIVANNDSTIRYDNDTFHVKVDANNVRGSSTFKLDVDDTNAITIDDNRRIGIGTDNPITKLNVHSGTTDLAAQIVSDDANVFLAFKDGNSTGNQQVQIGGVGNTCVVYAGGNERVRIGDLGNTGIGVVNPEDFHVKARALVLANGGDDVGITLDCNTNKEGSIYFADGSTGDNLRRGQIVYNHDGDSLRFVTNASERMRIDSSGRLLYGHSTNRSVYGVQAPVQIEGTSFDTSCLSLTANSSSQTPILLLARSRGSSLGSNTALNDGEIIGEVSFVPSDGTNTGHAAVRIQGVADDNLGENDVPGRFVIQTVPSGSASSVERFRIHNGGKLSVAGVYNGTTTGGSAVYVESDGDLLRYTSSLKYKTDVETIEDARADAILNCRPVWYRSKCDNDIKTEGSEKSDWGWYGFIAEEVAEIEPRLVNWATKDAVTQENGLNKTVERDPADYEAEGVRYDNFVPLLVNLQNVKRHRLMHLKLVSPLLKLTDK